MPVNYYGPGNWQGLPELGLTELLGGKEQSKSDANERARTGEEPIRSVDPSPIASYGPDLIKTNNAGSLGAGGNENSSGQTGGSKAPSGGSSSSKSSKDSSKKDSGGYDKDDVLSDAGLSNDKYQAWKRENGGDVFDYVSYVQNQKVEEERKKKEFEAGQRKKISEAYDPIYDELDRQIGLAPERKKEYQTMIDELTGNQLSTVETERGRGIETLGRAKEDVEDRKVESLRDLEADVVNSLEAGNLFLGARGAGDSSASGQISEAITRQATKSRSGVLNTAQKALKDIDVKIQDVNNLATDSINKIGQYKTEKLFEITQFFNEKIDTLKNQMANAKSTEKQALANLAMQTHTAFSQRLQQLDDSIASYVGNIETWQMQRQAELQDYATKLQMSAKTTSPNLSKYVTAFENAISLGMTPDMAASLAESETGYVLTEDQKKQLENYKGDTGIKSGVSVNPLTGERSIYQYSPDDIFGSYQEQIPGGSVLDAPATESKGGFKDFFSGLFD